MIKLTDNQHVSLGSLRGVSALVVVLAHTFQFFLARFFPDYFKYIGIIAQSSVMIFFSMSGFLIGKSIQQNISRNGSFKLSEYASSRFQRIYPPLVFSVLLVIVFYYASPYVFEFGKTTISSTTDTWLKGRGFNFSPLQIFSIMTFTNGLHPGWTPFNTPLWSLPLEVWYYVVAALLSTKKTFYVITAGILFFAASSVKEEFFIYSAVWFSGFFVAFIRHDTFKYQWVVASFALSYFSFMAYTSAIAFLRKEEDITYYNLMFGIFFTSFMYLTILHANVKIKIIPALSRFAYTLYISHYPILLFIAGIFESAILKSLLASFLIGLGAAATATLTAYWAAKLVEDKNSINKMLQTKNITV